MVTGEDSYFRCCEFVPLPCILDEYLDTFICRRQNFTVLRKDLKQKKKIRDGPYVLKIAFSKLISLIGGYREAKMQNRQNRFLATMIFASDDCNKSFCHEPDDT